LLTSCQEALDVSALNQCGSAVEARASDTTADFSVGWTTIGPGDRDNIVSAVEDVTELYVEVRADESDAPVEFSVTVADLPKPPEGVDDDVEVVLERDRCPDPAR